jgi:hypothetical protein
MRDNRTVTIKTLFKHGGKRKAVHISQCKFCFGMEFAPSRGLLEVAEFFYA